MHPALSGLVTMMTKQLGIVGVRDQHTYLTRLYSDQWSINYDLVSESES